MRGFVAISTVLVLMVVIVSTIATVTYLSIGEAQSSLSLVLGEENLSLVEGCVEDGLLKARSDATFGDSAVSITRPEGTCSIDPISKVGSTWTMTTTTTNVNYKRKIQTIFNRTSSGITLTSWKEI